MNKLMIVLGMTICLGVIGCGKAADSLLGDMEPSNTTTVSGNNNAVNVSSDNNTSTISKTTLPANE